MSGVLSVHTSDGLDIDIPLTYAGDALPGYNSGNISLSTPSQTVEYQVTAIRNMVGVSGEDTEASYIFDAETRRWSETNEFLSLSALASIDTLLGSDLSESSNIATAGQMALTGQETFDGVETRVISGKLSGAEIAGTDTELEVTYRIGVDDALLRQIEVSGDLDPSIIGALIEGVSADSVRTELTVNFSDYGKEVAYKSPHLAAARFSHNATLLDDGRVLVSGGYIGVFENDELLGFPASSSQFYDPLTATWTFTGELDPTYDHQTDRWTVFSAEEDSDLIPYTPPTKLLDGRLVSVTIVSGRYDANDSFGALAIFDTETNEWTHLSDVPTDRFSPGVIVLSDGRALVAGGSEVGSTASISPASLSIVESYDPSTDTWQTLEPMNQPAIERSFVRLNDGRILAVGGFIADPGRERWSDSVEIYNPDTNKWAPTASMNVERVLPQIVSLQDGRILATGMVESRNALVDNSPNAEIYNPATNEWTGTGAMSVQRIGYTLTLLPDGRVLIAGGVNTLDDDDYVPLSTTEIYDSTTNTWSPGPELSQTRAEHSAILMPDGRVLIAGGISQDGDSKYLTASTEFIEP